MSTAECMHCSFIVKVWVEETSDGPGQGVWRGRITHVPSGNRRYVKDLEEIAAFITRYLEEMGAKPVSRTTIWQRLKLLNRPQT